MIPQTGGLINDRNLFLTVLFFIGVQLLYNVVLVSAVPQSESAIRVHIFPSLLELPPPYPRPTHLDHHRAPS